MLVTNYTELVTKHIEQGCKLIFPGGHISLLVAFKGQNVTLGLYKCNYSVTVKPELSTVSGQKQGATQDKTRWRAGYSPWVLCVVIQRTRWAQSKPSYSQTQAIIKLIMIMHQNVYRHNFLVLN